jgi:hypothetical protein
MSGYFIFLRSIRTPYITIDMMFSPVLCGILCTVMNPGYDGRCRISPSFDVVTNSLLRSLVRDLVVRAALENGGNLDKSFAQKICYQFVYDGLFMFSSNKTISHIVVLLSHCFSTQSAIFSVPC